MQMVFQRKLNIIWSIYISIYIKQGGTNSGSNSECEIKGKTGVGGTVPQNNAEGQSQFFSNGSTVHVHTPGAPCIISTCMTMKKCCLLALPLFIAFNLDVFTLAIEDKSFKGHERINRFVWRLEAALVFA